MDREPLRSTPGVSHIWIGYDPETLEIHDRFEYEGDWYDYQDHLTYEVLPKTLRNKPYKLTEYGFELDEEKWTEMQPRVFERLRQERNRRLAETDWIFSTDYHIPSELRKKWTAYRQALRDLPSVTEDPENPVWPEKPTTDPSGGSTVSVDLDHIGNLTSQISLLQNVVFSLTKRIEALEQT